MSSSSATIRNNTIRNLSAAGGTGATSSASVAGIVCVSTSVNNTVSGNQIFNLSNSNTTAATVVTGIQYTNSSGRNLIERNLIHSLTSSSNSASAEINGIRIATGGTGAIATYQNNMIALGANTSNAILVTGINDQSTSTNTFFNNSVYIGGTATAGTANSFAFNSVGTTNTRVLRNNIFVNQRVNSLATGKNYAVQVGGNAANPTGLSIGNNIYFVSGTGTVFGRYNILDVVSLAAWRTAVGQDNLSIEANPQFLNPTATSPDLHLHPTNATPAEGNGAVVEVTDDFDGQTRSSLTPVDIGADAGNFQGIPVFNFTPLSNSSCITDISLSVAITDASGINSTAGTNPRVYYKKTTNANALGSTNDNTTNGWKFVQTSSTSSPFSFALDLSLINGGVAAGDVIQYFVVAQDLASTPVVGISDGSFAAVPASVSLTTAAFPIAGTIRSYSLSSGTAALSGTVTVGASGTYSSLTGASGLFSAINTNGISGNLTVLLQDASITESGATALNPISYGCSGPFTVTIRPSTGVTSTLTGSLASNSILRIFASNVTIDGSNSGGTTRNLSIANTSTTSPGILWLGSSGTTAIRNVTIRNTIITNGSNGNTGIVVGDATTPAAYGNPGYFNNIVFDNNDIRRTFNGLFISAAVVPGNGSGTVVSNNLLNNSGADAIRAVGINISGVDGLNISNNSIGNVNNTTDNTLVLGINIGTGTNNAVISQNIISNMTGTSTGGSATVSGIRLTPGNLATSLVVSDNVISNLTSPGTFAGFAGIASFGPNTNIRGNTISGMTQNGAVGFWGIVAASPRNCDISGNIVGALSTTTTGTANGINIQGGVEGVNVFNNNIFNLRNTNSGGYTAYGISLGAAAYNGINFGVRVNNNQISGIVGYGGSGGTASWNGYGIGVTAGAGYEIHHNTVNLNVDQLASGGLPAAFYVGSSVVVPGAISLQNNILVNSQTSATGVATRYAIYANTSSNLIFSTINNNNYYSAGTKLGFIGSDRSTLSDIITGFGGNQNSVSANSTFVSATDLHLASGSGQNWTVNNAGAPISSVTTDIDGDTRSPTNPDIGADEFTASSFVVTNPAAVCAPNTVDITAAALTAGTTSGTTFTYWTNAAGTITLTTPAAVATSGTYYIKATYGSADNYWIKPVVVVVNPLPTPTITGSAAICASSTGNVYSVTNVTGNTYAWTVTGGTITAGQGTNSITVTAGAAGTATVTVTETITATGCVNTATQVVTINPIPAPVISGQVACTTTEGNIFSVANVTGNTYAWSVAGGTVTAGAGTNAITVTWGAVGAGTVTVTQTITATGCATTVSRAIDVLALPTATAAVVQPVTCASEDGQINLTLGGAAGPYTYAWTGTGNGLSPTTQNQSAVSTGFYNVTVTAANGCTVTVPNIVVAGPGGCFICPTIGTISSTATIICQDGANTITAGGLADLGITYGVRFKYSATPLANPYLSTAGTVMGTVTNANLTVVGGTTTSTSASLTYNFPTAGTMYVYAILSPASPDPACRPFLMIPVEVAPTPALNAPVDQVLCSGSTTAAVSFAATPAATTSFAWTNNRTSIGLAASGTGNSIGAFTATNFTNAPVTATVTVTPTNTRTLGASTVTCPGPAQILTYTVNPIPTVNTVTNQQICAGTNVSLPFSGFAAGTAFAWTNSNTAIGLGASGAGTLSFTATNTTSSPITSSIVVTPRFANATGFKAYTAPGETEWCFIGEYDAVQGRYRIGIDSREFIGTGVQPSSINSLALFDLWNGPVTFESYDANSWALYWITTPTQFNFATSAFASSLRRANGFYGVSTEFTFANRSATCSGNPISFDITVNPTPVVDAIPAQVLCSGSATTALSLTSATTGTAFSWTNSATSIGLAGTGTGTSIASFTAVNTGAAPVNAIITVTPSYTGAGFTCTGTAGTTTITVNPIPTATAISNSVICNGAATTYALTSSATAATYNWTNSNTDIGLAGTGSGTIAFTASNTTAAPISSTITVTPSVTNGGLTCTGGTISFTVTVNPSGQVNAIDNQVLCNGSATSAVTFSTTNNGLISTGGTQVASSGTISIAVPDNTPAGVTHAIPVTLPTGAVITNMRVTMNLTHTWIEDMVINLRAPNGQILNLFNAHGGSGDNLVNTVISSTGTASLASGTAPFTGTYAATAAVGVGPTGNASTASNFAALYSTPNGNWVLALEDEFFGDLGTLTGWSISFDYTVQGQFGTNMNWTNSLASIGLAATGTGNIPSFTAANTTAAPVTSTVTVTPVYFNSGTSCPGTPATFTYTVNPTPTVSAVANQVFCAGSPSTVNFSGATTGTVYNWTSSNAAIGLAVSGSGNLSFTPTNTSNVPILSTIIVTPSYTNAGVTCTGTPRTFTITVNPVGQVNTVLSQVLCNGAATTAVNFATINGGGTVQVGTPVTVNSGAITIAVPDNNPAGATHTLPVTLPAGATITGISVNFNMTHTFVGDMGINLRAPNGQILNLVSRRGGAGDNFVNTNISSVGTTSLASGTAPFTGTYAADALLNVGPTNFVSTATNFAALYSVANGDWTLGMRDFAGGDLGTLTGWSITFNYTTVAGAVTTYNWTNTTPSIGLAASGVGNIASFAAANTSTVPVTATVSVIPTYTNAGVGCAGPASSFTYTVNPTPTVAAVSSQAVCVGSDVAAVAFVGTVSGTVYNWTNTNAAIGLPVSGTGDIASFVATNTTSAPISGTVTVTPVFTNAGITCSGTPRTFTITVNPIPTVNPVASFPVCHNSTAAVTFSGATTGTVYSWTNSNTAIGLAASGTGNISFTALNTTGAPVVATITVTPRFTSGGTTCTGTPRTFTITVNPLPVVSAGTLPARICISDTLVPLNGTPVGGSWSGIGTSGMNFVPTATAVGTWPITYTFSDLNGCTNRATIAATVLACEERDRDLDNRAVFLYPNPNNGQFFLRINSTRFNALGMRVFNTAGQLVSTKHWSGLVFARVIPVDLSNLPGGVYMVRLYYGDGMDRGADRTFQIIVTR